MAVYLFYGAVFLIWAVSSFIYPGVVVSKKLEKEFFGRENEKKGYLWHQRTNLFVLAAVLFLSVLIPVPVRLKVCLGGMGVVFISVLWCNQRYLGRFMAYRKGDR